MRKNIFVYVFLAVVILISLLISGAHAASPSLTGATGLIGIPTAECLKFKEFNISIDSTFKDGRFGRGNKFLYKANLGIFNNLEIGFVGGTVPKEGVFVNLKYTLWGGSERLPLGVAFGVENLCSDDMTDIYLVASKEFSFGMNGHFGFKADIENKKAKANIMIGAELFIGKSMSVVADVMGEQSEYLLNLGLRYNPIPKLQVRASILDATNSARKGQQYSFGLAWDGGL